jgi:hypothetical protein
MFSSNHLRKTAKIAGARKSMEASSGHPPETTPTAKATAVVEVIYTLLTLFGFESVTFKKRLQGKFQPYLGSKAHKADVKHWAELMEKCDWIKVAKYKIAAFYQYHNLPFLQDKTLPAKPFVSHTRYGSLLSGTAGRYIGRQIGRHLYSRSANDRVSREEFLSSILQLKKGMPRPEEDALESAKKKTFVALTTKKVRVESSVLAPGLHINEQTSRIRFVDIAKQVERTTKELFEGRAFTTSDLLSNPTMPSLSAAYSTSRAKLGTFGWLRDRNLLGKAGLTTLSAEERHTKPTMPMWMDVVRVDSWGRELPESEWYSRPRVQEEVRGEIEEVPTFTVKGIDGMKDQFVKTYFDTLKIAMGEDPVAELVALAEALKVRVITKGPPGTMYCLKPLQRFMRGHLAKHPVFELIGKPQSARVVERAMGKLRQGEFWLSGDYSDATNQIDPKLSSIVWDTMCDVCKVPVAIRQLGHRALTGHLIKEGNQLEIQLWGQLMGSIISFPILCVVNAAICRMSIEYSRGVASRLEDLPLLVNGDDCVFPVTPGGYQFWGEVGKMAGLSPSVGKVYFSDSFLNINSTNYQYSNPGPETEGDIDLHIALFTETKAVNLGLLFGMKRSEVDKDTDVKELVSDGWDSLGTRHRTLMQCSPLRTVQKVHQLFVKKNAETLEKAKQRGLPRYVPTCYGGVGMEPMVFQDGSSIGPSEMDRQIVTAMVNPLVWNMTGDHVPEVGKWKAASKTQIHSVALQMIKEALPTNITSRWVTPDSEEEDGLDLPELDLFVVYMHPEKVESPEGEQDKDLFVQNARVWDWFRKHMGEFAWMRPLEELKPLKRVYNVRLVSESGKRYIKPSDFELNEHWHDYQEVDLWSLP